MCQTICSLLTTHNLTYLFELMREMREAIAEDRFVDFVREFMWTRFYDEYPEWAAAALREVGITLGKKAKQDVNSMRSF